MESNKRPKNRNRLLYIGLGVLGLALILGVVGKKQGWIGKPKATIVQTGDAEFRDVFARVTESGVIQPTIEVPVAPDVSGEVVRIAVREGMVVQKGDLLVTIQPDDYIAQLEQAQASLNQVRAGNMQSQASVSQAEANYLRDSVSLVRNRLLFDDKVISKQELENMEMAYKVSKAQLTAAKYNLRASHYQVKNSEAMLKQARQNLDRTNIYASMDGTITFLGVELGQRVVGTRTMAGTDILRIADLSSMEVVVQINENDIVNVNEGDSAKIEVDAFPDQTYFGNVTEIAYSAVVSGGNSADQVTNFEVKVKIDPSSYASGPSLKDIPINEKSPFRPGMTALLEIFTKQSKDVVTVPIQAVTLSRTLKVDSTQQDSKAQEVVFIVDNEIAREVPVNTGISDDTYIEISGGLSSGEKVVTGPYTTLTKTLEDGEQVKVENKKKRSEDSKELSSR